jgi:hypothetical protein
MFTKKQLRGTAWADKLAGHIPFQVSEEVFDYFLEVLPPVHMRRFVKLTNGQNVMASFGFREGAEPTVAFWCQRVTGEAKITFWACLEL